MYKACVCSMLTYRAESWAMKVGGVSEAVSHRDKNAEKDLWSVVEG